MRPKAYKHDHGYQRRLNLDLFLITYYKDKITLHVMSCFPWYELKFN